ncbi:hypothetical protein CTA2_4196 [Colletotrichum tanaceti]|uniref:Aminoglycoside phosphotransferase domain-containing protein n=1 Tax=Colletotrichum tanaceti TaxID=1306861 RepID=A0A4U6X4S6_9PEZI|nr:hypothetical protein CTA2_4196 [Colletotrichum tanaceti]TKW49809.1 hypothetical protein CTA1_5853 [Colletotrichum tanaceti]
MALNKSACPSASLHDAPTGTSPASCDYRAYSVTAMWRQRRLAARITFESPEEVRKWGRSWRLRREVEAMAHVRRETSILVPAIIDVCLDDDPAKENCCFVMERLPGRQMDVAWPEMDDKARSETVRQLRAYLDELHQLRPSDPGFIGSVTGGPAYDHRITNMRTCGPFASVAEFHDFLVAPVRKSPRPEWFAKYRSQLPDTYDVRFSHADLSWENILVDGSTGRVTGILDWEMAGYWPEWWEYSKAVRSAGWWIDIMKQVMVEYPREADLDSDLEMF